MYECVDPTLRLPFPLFAAPLYMLRDGIFHPTMRNYSPLARAHPPTLCPDASTAWLPLLGMYTTLSLPLCLPSPPFLYFLLLCEILLPPCVSLCVFCLRFLYFIPLLLLMPCSTTTPHSFLPFLLSIILFSFGLIFFLPALSSYHCTCLLFHKPPLLPLPLSFSLLLFYYLILLLLITLLFLHASSPSQVSWLA